MKTRQPFHVIPIKSGKRHHQKTSRNARGQLVTYLSGAALLGALIGTGSVAIAPGGVDALAEAAKPFAVRLGMTRARLPQEGNHWTGCDAARAAGTAPIYIGEPGYRAGMDGDADGVACEAYYGR